MKQLLIKTCLILFCTMWFVQSEAQWIQTLPQDVQDGILWKADHENNDLCEWTSCGYQYPGGGIFNDVPDEVTVEASSTLAHSGNYSAYTQITNVCQAQSPKHAVRLMRWTDAPFDNGGSLFPTATYYSTWMYLPHTYNSNKYQPWDPGDGGWWNVFQFKSKESDGESHPVFTFNIAHDDDNDEMYFYMYTKENQPSQYSQSGAYKAIPEGQWVHLEALYVASDPYTPNGQVKFWQDGDLILEANNVVTQLAERVIFGIGNYTDHVDGYEGCGTASIYFDDVIVGTEAVHPHIEDTPPPPPPPPATECDLIDNGDFSSDLQDWADWGCEMELQNGEAFVDISSNSAGLKKGNTLTFEEGKTYRITFDARAESGRNMKVKATLDYSPYDLYFQEEVALTTSMQSYELTFTMNQYSPDSALEFNFKGSTTNVYLDNVQVSEIDCGTTPPPPPPSTECDLIDNGDFSSDLQDWSDWGCEMELQNGEAFVDISSNSAGLKKGNGSFDFEEGKTYRITFDARAESGRNMKVKAVLDYSPYTKYFEEEVALTTSMQSFEMTFTMGQYSAASALGFSFKNSTTNVFLDNVQVSEVDCGTTPPPPPPPSAECDLIDNGDFNSDLQGWSDWGCEMYLQNEEAFVDISSNSAGLKKGVGFEQGKTYRINFDARAETARNVKVRATLDYSPYTKYFEQEVALTSTMQSYEMTFTMDQYSPDTALEFNFKGSRTNIYLDNVQVTELDCTARGDVYEADSFQATAYPNPFNGQTQLEYELFGDSEIQVNVYNTMGQLVNTPVPAQAQTAGTHRIYFGENIPSGIYFCELKVDDVRKIIKIVKGN